MSKRCVDINPPTNYRTCTMRPPTHGASASELFRAWLELGSLGLVCDGGLWASEFGVAKG